MSFRYWFNESLGFKNTRHLMAWGLAGGLAYVLWVLPAQRDEARRKAIVEEWREKYKAQPGYYSPAYDPQNPGKQAESLKGTAPSREIS